MCCAASQDVLVVTAPGSGAEIIPFLKTWVNLPMAIAFTIGYAKVRVQRNRDQGSPSRLCAGDSHDSKKIPEPNSSPPRPLQMANVLSAESLFYTCVIPFIIFFGGFAALLYPMRDALHPTGEENKRNLVHVTGRIACDGRNAMKKHMCFY